ncbi:hypothetical protein GCM10009630_53470 [Kribbella jejuensis]|uniref:Uncharacterized protein n=2 Tax=Kribbella jejuensis TaxID=236068 RepID=A0A542ETG6_9ACTN|nr:hypothetical protein FB475_2800 [Kribbella jejuensis]
MNSDEKRNRDAALPGLTVQREVATVALQAQLTGTLGIDASTNCIVVRSLISTSPGTDSLVDIDVAWPPGWSVGLRGGAPALIDETGQVACRPGDEIALGGGFKDTSRMGVVSCTGQGRVFDAYRLTRT